MKIPQSTPSRLRLAAALLKRFVKHYENVPDEPKWPPGSTGRLAQETRAFLRALAPAASTEKP